MRVRVFLKDGRTGKSCDVRTYRGATDGQTFRARAFFYLTVLPVLQATNCRCGEKASSYWRVWVPLPKEVHSVASTRLFPQFTRLSLCRLPRSLEFRTCAASLSVF